MLWGQIHLYLPPEHPIIDIKNNRIQNGRRICEMSYMRQLIRLAWFPGRILLSLHTGNSARSTGMKFKKKKVDITCGCLVNSCNFTNEANSYIPKVEMHTRQKLGHSGRYVAKAKLFCVRNVVPIIRARLECS